MGKDKIVLPACGNPGCGVSFTIAEHLSFGSGELSYYGFWERSCNTCARAFEAAHPEHGPCWPHTREQLIEMGFSKAEIEDGRYEEKR